MKITGLHILLTNQCSLECDHCFVWGGPHQEGTLNLQQVDRILDQAKQAGTVDSIYFEGGEPFLYYPILLEAVRNAAGLGFQVGLVSNGYWAIGLRDALSWLRPFAGLVSDLSISSDLFHWSEKLSSQARIACQAAEQLGIPAGVIQVAQPGAEAGSGLGQLLPGESSVMFRGRAAEKLAGRVLGQPWDRFTACPHENLREPDRLHVDPFGNLHVCQGIVLGNIFNESLSDICSGYRPEWHPIIGPLLAYGPVELVRRYKLPHQERYADACHLCYTARQALRLRFPGILGPDQMYGGKSCEMVVG